ncbi:MAG TPA: hypothetical protein DEO88_08610 [Syntrophobacteraceae bacterium]|jgi:hypothetical protein|nr:hypothetical protein [Syntrophobacteraceae bacterium]
MDHPPNEYPVFMMRWNDKAKESITDYHNSNFPFDQIALAPRAGGLFGRRGKLLPGGEWA